MSETRKQEKPHKKYFSSNKCTAFFTIIYFFKGVELNKIKKISDKTSYLRDVPGRECVRMQCVAEVLDKHLDLMVSTLRQSRAHTQATKQLARRPVTRRLLAQNAPDINLICALQRTEALALDH